MPERMLLIAKISVENRSTRMRSLVSAWIGTGKLGAMPQRADINVGAKIPATNPIAAVRIKIVLTT